MNQLKRLEQLETRAGLHRKHLVWVRDEVTRQKALALYQERNGKVRPGDKIIYISFESRDCELAA